MKAAAKKIIKCAIYTRKSSEEGLEQDFNSLDAQREACESYIKSQQHEGWVLVVKQYDDGGFSGGTLERPALKELFQDIEDGKIDTVVVYKIDRLTRSLMDFSKIVELFDKKAVTFVSITQQFNTTTSMGRLTLNILLSFAQFEREVTGERIRDKIAASKKKGMWMSGKAPLGYQLKDRKLVVDEDNAEIVRNIFNKYLELRSVPDLISYLKENDIKRPNNMPFTKGPLYHLLQNKVYIGLITHKDKVYEGEHEAIINKELFEKVQQVLIENRITKKCSINSKSPSLLASKLFDDKGNYMSPSHSNKKGKRYRYYVSQALLQSRKHEAGSVSKIPAGEIEAVIIEEIKTFLFDNMNIHQYIGHFDIHKQKTILSKLEKLDLTNNLIRALVAKVLLYKEKIEIILCKDQLLKVLESIITDAHLFEEAKPDTENPLKIIKNIRISTTSRKGSVIIVNNQENKEVNINPLLVKIIAKSYYWNKLIDEGKAQHSKDIQKIEKMTDNDYIKKALGLRILSPKIVEAILNGHQPEDLTVQKLLQVKTLDWQEQEKQLNFARY